MSSHTPPPLPDPDGAFRTYVRAVALLIPTIFVWLFATTFLVPKLEQLWKDAGLTGSKAQWFMNATYALKQNFTFVLAGVVVVLLLLEFRWAAWPRYRRVVVASASLFFHTVVLVGITMIATAALLAAPLLARAK